MKNNTHLTNELSSKKEALNKGISEALNISKKTIKVTIRDQLREFNSELIRFKNSGISYKLIRVIIKDRTGLKVSEQTLREHCQQELGFQKRGSYQDIEMISTTATEQLDLQLPVENKDPPEPSMQLKKAEQISKQTQSLINKIEDY